MSEQGWGSDIEESVRPARRGLPGWMWGCGAGCGLVLIVVVLGFWYVARLVGKAADQDLQWERVAEVLPFDQRPPGVHLFGIPFRIEGTAFWWMTDSAGQRAAMLVHSAPSADAARTRREFLDPEASVSVDLPFGGVGRTQVEPGTVEVQGRALTCLRYQGDETDGEAANPFQRSMKGASLVVDLAPDDSEELLVMLLIKLNSQERVSDDEVRAFLAPFRLPGAPAPPEEVPAPAPDASEDEESR